MLYAQHALHTIYTRYDVEDGLPQNLVSGIVQDADGFIWLSTLDGLARFDGKEFLVLRHLPDDSTSLEYNSIKNLFIDQHNQLWVQYINYEFNAVSSQTFRANIPTPLSFSVGEDFYEKENINGGLQYILGDKRNWLLSHVRPKDGHFVLELMDSSNRKLKEFLDTHHQKFGNKIFDFAEDTAGKIWLATTEGLEVSDSNWVDFKSIVFPVEFQFNPDEIDFKIKLVLLNDQRMAICQGKKIVIYDPKTERVKAVSANIPDRNGSSINYSSVTKDIQGRLVFEYQGYIYRIDHNDELSLLWKYPGENYIRSIYIDNTNTLWVGTDADGLYKINLLTAAFTSRPYQHNFLSDVLINELGINQRAVEERDFSPQASYFSRYCYNDAQELFIYFEDNNGYRITQINDKSLVTVYRSEYPGQFAFGKDKRFWFLNAKGYLYRWHTFSEKPEIIKTELHLDFNGYSNLNDLLIDDDNYWVSVPSLGLFKFKEDKIEQQADLSGNYNTHIIRQDPNWDSVLWIGTVGGGLYKWDKIEGKLLGTYTTENGLPNNTINSLIADANGMLWLSTNRGITRFNQVKETFSHFKIVDGLMESEFNRHHDMLLPDGRIAMGGAKGYTVFNPADFTEDNYEPEIQLTKFSINNIFSSSFSDKSGKIFPINQLRQIVLNYDENTFGFDMAATQFNAPEKIKYRYQLEGYDRNWVETNGSRSISFIQLPYGKYTLLLNASNTMGVWSPAIRKINVIVNPPFWLSYWAYAFYAIVLAVLLRFYWQGYKKRLQRKQEIEFNLRETKRLRELDEIKTRFFSNITHEFRTPLTLILSPLEKSLEDNTLSPKARTLLNNNYRHASQLLNLVNQLLDISKLETGQMRVNATAGELPVFLEQCMLSFQEMASKKHITFDFNLSGLRGHYLFDYEKWEKIVYNLLSNAIKFTPQNGKVSFLVTEHIESATGKNEIVLKVSDSGIGIASEDIAKIFNRFYQVDDSATRKHEGTGIGLALTKELVDLMGGSIEVNSKLGFGSAFTVKIPVEKLKEIPTAINVKGIQEFDVKNGFSIKGIDHDKPLLLVVEDNDELRSFITESLSANWKVLDAANAFDAWTIIERELPEVVITDVMMPGMNGFELCKKSKQDDRTAHIGFIMLTARAAQASKIEGLESGADEYLTKPFHLYELELRIRNLLIEQDSLQKHLQDKLFPNKPLPQSPQIKDVFLQKLKTYLDENLDNSELSVDNVAAAMAMSKSTVNRKLKALLNITVNDFIKQYRLQKSTALLALGYNVSEVSYRVGFETPSYFAQCFKEYYRQTPTEFIKSNH
jgi:signal transduction histidine kinase/DNA-binding response OmpR family regulator/ligand-binding sensor domain-containing protein